MFGNAVELVDVSGEPALFCKCMCNVYDIDQRRIRIQGIDKFAGEGADLRGVGEGEDVIRKNVVRKSILFSTGNS